MLSPLSCLCGETWMVCIICSSIRSQSSSCRQRSGSGATLVSRFSLAIAIGDFGFCCIRSSRYCWYESDSRHLWLASLLCSGVATISTLNLLGTISTKAETIRIAVLNPRSNVNSASDSSHLATWWGGSVCLYNQSKEAWSVYSCNPCLYRYGWK